MNDFGARKFQTGQRVYFVGYDQVGLYRMHHQHGGAVVTRYRSRADASTRDHIYGVECDCGYTTWTTRASLGITPVYRERREHALARLPTGVRVEAEREPLPEMGATCERCNGWIDRTRDEEGMDYGHCVMCGSRTY